MSNDRPILPINRENLDRLTLALEHMADAATQAARRAEVSLRRVSEIMARHAAP